MKIRRHLRKSRANKPKLEYTIPRMHRARRTTPWQTASSCAKPVPVQTRTLSQIIPTPKRLSEISYRDLVDAKVKTPSVAKKIAVIE